MTGWGAVLFNVIFWGLMVPGGFLLAYRIGYRMELADQQWWAERLRRMSEGDR